MIMFETWKRSADKGKVFRALLTDLSKAFDELLTVKLNINMVLACLNYDSLIIIYQTEKKSKNWAHLQQMVRRFYTRTNAF